MSRRVPLGLLSFKHFEKMHEDNHSPEQAQISPTRLGGNLCSNSAGHSRRTPGRCDHGSQMTNILGTSSEAWRTCRSFGRHRLEWPSVCTRGPPPRPISHPPYPTKLRHENEPGAEEIRLAHFSVKEYPTSSDLRASAASEFAHDHRAANQFLTESCLIYILQYDQAVNRSGSNEDLWVFRC